VNSAESSCSNSFLLTVSVMAPLSGSTPLTSLSGTNRPSPDRWAGSTTRWVMTHGLAPRSATTQTRWPTSPSVQRTWAPMVY
jgi:hypothetical protein